MLSYGADVSDTDEKEYTCVRWAAEYNQVQVLKVILDFMKRERLKTQDLIEQSDQFGEAPLHVAAKLGHPEFLTVKTTNKIP